MPSNITPVSTWTTPLTGPANGDAVDGGAGGAAFDMGQKLSNRIEFLKDLLLLNVHGMLHDQDTPATEATSKETLDNTGVYVNAATWAGLTLANAAIGDILVVGANIKIAHTAVGGAAGLGIQLTNNGNIIAGTRSERTSTGIGYSDTFNVMACYSVIASGNQLVRLQTYVAGVTAEWQGSWSIWAALIGANTF